MRCALRGWTRLVPAASGLLLFGPCGITDRQFSDFLITTALQIAVQSLFSIVGAAFV